MTTRAAVCFLALLMVSPNAEAQGRKDPAWTNEQDVRSATEARNLRTQAVPYRRMPSGSSPDVLHQALQSDGASFPAGSIFSSASGAFHGNFQLVVPLVRLPGRGMDLHLT